MTNHSTTPDSFLGPSLRGAAEAVVPQFANAGFAHEVNDALSRLNEIDDETLFLARAKSVEEWRNFNRNLTSEQLDYTGAEREALLARSGFLRNRGAAINDVLIGRGLLRWGVNHPDLDTRMAEKSRKDADTTAKVDAALALSDVAQSAGYTLMTGKSIKVEAVKLAYVGHPEGRESRLEDAASAAIGWMRPSFDDRTTESVLFYRQTAALRNLLEPDELTELHRRVGDTIPDEN